MIIHSYIYILKQFYVFIFGCVEFSLLCQLFSTCGQQGLLCSCGVWAFHCGGFSCCRAWALGMQASVAVAHGISSCGSWALEHRFSTCSHRLNCSTACRIFPYQGSNLCLLHWHADSLPLSRQGSPKLYILWEIIFWVKQMSYWLGLREKMNYWYKLKSVRVLESGYFLMLSNFYGWVV